ncbi:DUF397 domain-containing protein [Streptomyces sp. WI04-05B]|nr:MULTISPECIES: DUF397 domain-containing protein [unclassified Streptomyces]MDX2542571.1 DUF397 domain-containing protein [Streptomyces sp. WI04-05B]MDX2582410.1 DUF397 domain-containing protein [Streptomyces sp. WI04-05A]MDX3747823.1 DUF397 domain-containing protein [Streptomyces sp. AK08-02]
MKPAGSFAVRDSEDPAHGSLTFPARAFAAFVEVLKTDTARPTA